MITTHKLMLCYFLNQVECSKLCRKVHSLKNYNVTIDNKVQIILYCFLSAKYSNCFAKEALFEQSTLIKILCTEVSSQLFYSVYHAFPNKLSTKPHGCLTYIPPFNLNGLAIPG